MYSMTGYGRATCMKDGRSLTIELKSVNHRFLDLNFRMPRSFLFLEDAARRQIAASLSRGHVDVFVTYVNRRDDSRMVRVDEGLVKAYEEALNQVEKLTGVKDDRSLSLFARLPDALMIDEAGEDEDALRALLNETLAQALDSLNAMRAREGEAMKRDMLEKLEEIATSFNGVEKSYAIQAGREVRIMVKPEVISDDQMVLVARDIVKKIEDELEYPGQIKVNIIRESRACDFAK